MSTLDDSVAERLVLLRTLFESARERARDTTDVGRHTSLILLDGACELALRHATDQLGVAKKAQTNFEALYESLPGSVLGASGAIGGWAGVRQLHRARNDAQHAGILPDPGQVARWAGDTETFLDKLIETTFQVHLTEVHRADALSNPVLRELFERAEVALETGDATDAVDKGLEAFSVARSHWKLHRQSLGLASPGTGLMGAFSDTVVEQSVQQLDDFVEVQPFALDMGEYLWLCDVARRPGPPPDLDEARRVLVFVFAWILRWETFAARYDANAVKTWRSQVRPPTTSQPELGPRLDVTPRIDVTGQISPDARPFITVTLQVLDAPAQDFELWLADVQSELVEAWRSAQPGETYVLPTADRAGRIAFPSTHPEVDAQAVVAIARRAIEAANAKKAMREETGAEVVDPYREAVLAVVDKDNVPLFVSATSTYADGTDTSPVSLRAVVAIEPRPDLYEHLRDPSFPYWVQTHSRARVDVDGDPPVVRVDRTVGPETIASALSAAFTTVDTEFNARSDARARRGEIETEVAQRFRQALTNTPSE